MHPNATPQLSSLPAQILPPFPLLDSSSSPEAHAAATRARARAITGIAPVYSAYRGGATDSGDAKARTTTLPSTLRLAKPRTGYGHGYYKRPFAGHFHASDARGNEMHRLIAYLPLLRRTRWELSLLSIAQTGKPVHVEHVQMQAAVTATVTTVSPSL